MVSVSGYLIGSQQASKAPLPPKAELQWWYQFYFATERGREGYDRYRRDFAKLIWQPAIHPVRRIAGADKALIDGGGMNRSAKPKPLALTVAPPEWSAGQLAQRPLEGPGNDGFRIKAAAASGPRSFLGLAPRFDRGAVAAKERLISYGTLAGLQHMI